MMRTPAHWYPEDRAPTLWAKLLAPLGRLYTFGSARRVARTKTAYRAQIPVICAGNITAGGSGKTPLVADLMQRLSDHNRRPCVISKGYGAKSLSGPLRVDPNRHSAEDVGDEPLFLSAFGAVIVAPDRPSAIQQAQADGFDIVILDDGFQDPSVDKDLSIVVIDAAKGFGNGLGIPAGPLREDIDAGLRRADMIVSLGPEAAQTHLTTELAHHTPRPRAIGALEALPTGMPWDGQRCIGFAGIAAPERFLKTLHLLGAQVVHFEALGDHEVINPRLFERLQTRAWAEDAILVTTEKDAARLTTQQRPHVTPVPVRIHWRDAEALDRMLERFISE